MDKECVSTSHVPPILIRYSLILKYYNRIYPKNKIDFQYNSIVIYDTSISFRLADKSKARAETSAKTPGSGRSGAQTVRWSI